LSRVRTRVEPRRARHRQRGLPALPHQTGPATSYAQEREFDEACRTATEAVSIPTKLRIGPIMRRVHDFERELAAALATLPPVREFREQVRELATT